MQSDIVLDIDKLHQKSVEVDTSSGEQDSILSDMLFCFPPQALGIAAPQVGHQKRMFLANLSCGKYVFINPEITSYSPDKVPSPEACLSLPGVSRCVIRSQTVRIKAPAVIQLDCCLEHVKSDFINFEKSFRGLDAFIIQHENDHLDGVLITDLPEAFTSEQKSTEKRIERNKRVAEQRKKNDQPATGLQKVTSPKRLKKLKKLHKKMQNKFIKRVQRDEAFEFLHAKK